MKVGCGIMGGEYSERRFVYRVEEIEELYCIATKTVAAPCPLSPAGPSLDEWHVALSSRRRSAVCPGCQHRSRAVHRAYRRTGADLPLAGATLFLHLQVRRFCCRHATCPRRIFAERFPTLVPVRGRHSLGVYSALRHVGLAVGGRAGVRLTRALGIPGSSRTIVRLVHDAPFPPLQVPRVSGLDEWA